MGIPICSQHTEAHQLTSSIHAQSFQSAFSASLLKRNSQLFQKERLQETCHRRKEGTKNKNNARSRRKLQKELALKISKKEEMILYPLNKNTQKRTLGHKKK